MRIVFIYVIIIYLLDAFVGKMLQKDVYLFCSICFCGINVMSFSR